MNGTFDPVIRIGDLRAFNCVRGIKKAFGTAGLDFHRFIQHGARASELRGHGYDAVIDRAVDAIRSRESV